MALSSLLLVQIDSPPTQLSRSARVAYALHALETVKLKPVFVSPPEGANLLHELRVAGSAGAEHFLQPDLGGFEIAGELLQPRVWRVRHEPARQQRGQLPAKDRKSVV